MSQAGVAALNFFGYINAFVLMLIILIWSRALHSRLRDALLCMSHRARTPRHTFYTHTHLDATHRAHLPGLHLIDSRVRALPWTDDPLTVFHDTTEDMDANEVATLYGILDKNGDEQVTIDRYE